MPPCRQYTGQVCRAIAIAYTVWAKKKGGGKHMVNEVYKMIKNSNHLDRLITLSPLTDMARKFHLKNGAKEVQVNLTTQNFEYDIELDEWEKFRDKGQEGVEDSINYEKTYINYFLTFTSQVR